MAERINNMRISLSVQLKAGACSIISYIKLAEEKRQGSRRLRKRGLSVHERKL
jgi:hypothetical protein